jgi:hypothetical protein
VDIAVVIETETLPLGRNFGIDTIPFPQLVSATMKTALILVVGKRVGKAV